MFKGRHFDQSVILLCVRWYLACNLSPRDLEEKMAERGLSVDHSTVHRWVVHFSLQLLERFNQRKRSVTGRWHMDQTCSKVRGRWMYLYRAIDSIHMMRNRQARYAYNPFDRRAVRNPRCLIDRQKLPVHGLPHLVCFLPHWPP
ncbi:DDE superfamily endonuclease [Mesorhizobium tianshanense]|uniref:DDE superfamily endonuclease n=1 Tax=Mesorhizobium tianshanense TaxID=39844 RepID=A0A562MGR9_9HYPH|nr:DDE superfamily endonuclease [Mesorhizobium tianshanense]